LKNPVFKIFTGPMFGGKTTKLLASLERYKYQKKKIILFKPWIDERYSKQDVVTHDGQHCPSCLIKRGEEIVEKSKLYDVVAVDEVFMIPGSAKALIEIFTSGKSILVSSLQLSSKPDPLPEIKDILPYATHIEICPAVCSMCDADAHYTRRKIDTDGVVQVGGAEMYEPLCFYHYNKVVDFLNDERN